MQIELKGSKRPQRIYYFCRDVRAEAIQFVPDGYVVVESPRTKMPVLKKV